MVKFELKNINTMGLKNVNTMGGCIVLCNHLDGAVADYEQGSVDNVMFLISCIYCLKLLGDPTWEYYYKRVEAVKRKEK